MSKNIKEPFLVDLSGGTSEKDKTKTETFSRARYQEWLALPASKRERLGKIITAQDESGLETLRQISAPVGSLEFKSPRFHLLLAHLIGVATAVNGLGLAAIQLGEPRRVFVAYVGSLIKEDINNGQRRRAEDYRFFVNLDWREGSNAFKDFLQEGCLSIPNVSFQIDRWRAIDINYDAPWGEHQMEIGVTGRLAHIIQHEADHAIGVISNDHVLPLFRRENKT